MHCPETEKELERRLNSIISEAKAIPPKKSVTRKIISLALFCITIVVVTLPLWMAWDSHPQEIKAPVFYKVKRVTVEYPDGMEPIVKLRPQKSGCAFMPAAKMPGTTKTI